MFIGSINQNCRRFLSTHASLFNGKRCVVGCSGNFTFEQLLSLAAQPAKICSNDVSIYSCAVGALLTGQDFKIELKADGNEWLVPFCTDPLDTLATILLLTEFLKFNPEKGIWHRRMHEHYTNNWAGYHSETKDNLVKSLGNIKITSFFAGDVFEHYKLNDHPDSIFMSFMPTYKGGYERIYKKLDEIFDWEKPSYEMLDDGRRDKIYEYLTARKYVIYDDRRLDLPLVFAEHSSSRRNVYMYSNLESPRILLKQQRSIAQQSYPMIGLHDEISPKSRVKFLPVSNKVVNYYREMFLSKSIAYVDGQYPLLVFIDAKLIGCAIFGLSKFGGTAKGDIYLLSDFVVSGSRYKRLSKLLLYLLTTKPIKQALEEKFFIRVKTIYTTAFTKKPTSAKYRGVFTLVKRGKGFLNYCAPAGTRTIKQAMREWTDKFSKQLIS